MTKLKLAKLNNQPEIFYSIQGEGRNLGQPSIFVRTSLCNLHCVWCDTDYTWNWENTSFEHAKDITPNYKKFKKSDYIIELSIDKIITYIEKYPCKNLVLTGGEPMLHQPSLVDLMQTLKAKSTDYYFETETNGTLLPTPEFDALINQYNVSAKLANSNNPTKLRERPKVYQFFAKSPKAWFKFVIDTQKDLKEVLELRDKYQIPEDRIYLMPQGTNPKMLREKQQWLVDICKTEGFNYTDRLHIHIYGDKRGV